MKYFDAIRVLLACALLTQQHGHAEALPELIEGVLSTHPTLRSQRSLGDAAKQAVETAEWQFFPTPSIGFEQVDAASNNDLNYPTTGDKNVTTVRLQQPLWTGGRLTAGLSKAQSGELVSQATLENARQELALRVVQLYADWYGAHLKREAYEKSLKAHLGLQTQIVRRISGGVSPPSDLTLLLGRAQQTDADLAATVAQEQSALSRISQLLGRVLQAQALTSTISAPQTVGDDVNDLLDQAQTQSPGVIKLQAQARIAEAEIAERKSDLMPEAYLRAERQYGSFTVSGNAPQNRYFIGFSSRFGAGLSAMSQVSGAQARLDAALADVETSRLAIGEQIHADYAQAKAGDNRLQSLQASLESSDKITRAWNRQFIAGRKTWLDVMNAVRELAQLEAQIADAKSSQLLLSWRLAINGRGLDSALSQGKYQQTRTSLETDRENSRDLTDTEFANDIDNATLQLRMALKLTPLRTGATLDASETQPDKRSEGPW